MLFRSQLIGLQECFSCAIQMAVVGYGGKELTKFYIGETLTDMRSFFDDNGIIYNSGRDTKLEDDVLTPRRLVRLFRMSIKQYLEKNIEVSSYLYRKYTNQDPAFRTKVYPGAEYLIEDSTHYDYLLNAYESLDSHLDKIGKPSGISERIKRIMIAKKPNSVTAKIA